MVTREVVSFIVVKHDNAIVNSIILPDQTTTHGRVCELDDGLRYGQSLL